MSYDPVTEDCPYDPEHPATMLEVEIPSGNAILLGRAYLAAGAGPHPMAIFLHGIPGHEQNMDIAHAVRRAGWNAVVFHYQGSWGSTGVYRFNHVLANVEAALAYFRQPEVAQTFRTDPARIILIGHSLGGWATLMTMAKGLVDTAAAIAPINMGMMGEMLREDEDIVRPMMQQLFAPLVIRLNDVTADDLVGEIYAADAWDYYQMVPEFIEKRLLLVGAERDDVVPPGQHLLPLVSLLNKSNMTQLSYQSLPADHVFSYQRIALTRLIVDWLGTL
ncbi:alpha/beta fold hydrolase [Phototrophicus methaneseepsis]|uniref:Alpha/beta fold hydrolase n=1 Tax=Phototrophicus methaneseepsis TaxID=2710758 RepID=A0A7S8EBQ6_9CHLR|nr:alpha/beta fold hydrolase [Phototrophicus methaneseepsis]QPC83843.1 alpha/beta fold hydrolase [Phototrophicus methaneseepsis]